MLTSDPVGERFSLLEFFCFDFDSSIVGWVIFVMLASFSAASIAFLTSGQGRSASRAFARPLSNKGYLITRWIGSRRKAISGSAGSSAPAEFSSVFWRNSHCAFARAISESSFFGKRLPGLDFRGESLRFRKFTLLLSELVPASFKFWTDLPEMIVWRRKTAEVERNKSVFVLRSVGKEEFSRRELSSGEGAEEGLK